MTKTGEVKEIVSDFMNLLREGLNQPPEKPSTEAEISAREAAREARESARKIEEALILERSGLPDIQSFNQMTALSPREVFVLEMRTTPERFLLENPASESGLESFNLWGVRAGKVELTAREHFIVANYMTPEAHAFKNPDDHEAAIAKFFADSQNPYVSNRLN